MDVSLRGAFVVFLIISIHPSIHSLKFDELAENIVLSFFFHAQMMSVK